ncbi:MAG: thiol reductant ABC exporter subunit CydC [Rhodospirillales bacterium]|nr:thiol reductant ABC exporter subunit CydC [Rhodospirillales bacterium]
MNEVAGPLLRVIGRWRGQSGWLVLGAVVSLAALGSAIGLMLVAGAALTVRRGGAAVPHPIALLALAAGGSLLAAPLLLRALGSGRVVLRYLDRLTSHAATFRALAALRVWFFRGLAANSAGGLGFRHAGDVLARLVGDVEALDGLYVRILLPLIGALVLAPVLAVALGLFSIPLAAIVTALFVLAAFVLPLRAARGTAAAGQSQAEAAAALRIAILDTLSGLPEVRAFGAEGRMLASVQAREAQLLAAQRAQARRVATFGAGALLLGQVAVLAVLTMATRHPSAAIVAAFLVVAAFEAVGGLARAGALAGQASAAARRVLEAAEAPAVVADPPHPAPMPATHTLTFEAVRFRWQPDLPYVFEQLDLSIAPGTRIALLGPSGIGKSSLAALALRLAAPESGRILLGGTDIATLPAAGLHARIAWLSQTTHLFADTIRNNLRLCCPDADDAMLWQALEAARIADAVRALPEGLDTWLGEGGAGFSGGQGRRLALARTLLSPAPILILDEPCAGLDAATERDFLTTLNEVAAGRTVILIAHRLTGVERLDRIWRLSGGVAVAAAA